MIKLARKASSKLRGTAKNNIPTGNTFIFHITIHIKTKPKNHERNVVCIIENFFAIMNIEMAKHSDQSPQTAPLTGSEGNVNPSDW